MAGVEQACIGLHLTGHGRKNPSYRTFVIGEIHARYPERMYALQDG